MEDLVGFTPRGDVTVASKGACPALEGYRRSATREQHEQKDDCACGASRAPENEGNDLFVLVAEDDAELRGLLAGTLVEEAGAR